MKYQKKPVVINAVQYISTNIEELKILFDETPIVARPIIGYDRITIYTLEGKMTARYGDWIIKGIEGEFYPCKPSVFAATYEEVKGKET